jgi:hypothetical protein
LQSCTALYNLFILFNFKSVNDSALRNYFLACIAALLFLAACKKNTAANSSAIITISPMLEAPGTPVDITGLHFDSVASHITVEFNDISGLRRHFLVNASVVPPLRSAAMDIMG